VNAKDSKKSPRVIHREYKDPQGNIRTEYKDPQGNIHTEYQDPQGNIHSYKSGHVDGHLAEEQNQDVRESRADKNISKGVLIGVIVTCVAGLTAGTIYFLTKLNNPQPVSVINVPTYESTPAPSPPPQQVRVVEQPIVKVVPVPQTQAPGSTENITVQPSASNPSSKQESINAAKPSNNSGTSVPKPTAVSPSKGNVTSPTLTKTDSDLKTEILKQFQDNLPNNQLIVEVKNGEVTVSGTVATPEQLQQIQPLLKSIQGIGKVDMTATVASKGVAE
jgi:hypothetical protein